MTNNTRKPREFWIRNDDVLEGPSSLANERIRVIEYNAYTDMMVRASNASLEYTKIQRENEDLRKTNEQLKEELYAMKVERDELAEKLITWAVEHPTYQLSKQLEAENNELIEERDEYRAALEFVNVRSKEGYYGNLVSEVLAKYPSKEIK